MPKFSGGTAIDSKGYLVITAGPHRGRRVHTLVAEAMLGRKLRPDEEVHHRDGDKLNADWRNLEVLGKAAHGAVSARQAWYFRQNDIKLKKEWDAFFAEANNSVGAAEFQETGEQVDRTDRIDAADRTDAAEGDVTFP